MSFKPGLKNVSEGLTLAQLANPNITCAHILLLLFRSSELQNIAGHNFIVICIQQSSVISTASILFLITPQKS